MSDPIFVILSFEGPDRYCRAGALSNRVTDLAGALASLGFETHLFFVGDPALPGHERVGDRLWLHRWGQWLSRFHPGGVYSGEEDKRLDMERSLPPWLERELLTPRVSAGQQVVVMGEEWQTAGAIVALGQIVDREGWRRQVHLLWNANADVSLQRIDWEALKGAATITTVSWRMRQVLRGYGVDAYVIPNGISREWLQPVESATLASMGHLLSGRLTLVKLACWDPEGRWQTAMEAAARLKEQELRPLLLACGGLGVHRCDILTVAQARGLQVASIYWSGEDPHALIEALRPAVAADVINLQGCLSRPQRQVLFRAADVVLADTGVSPIGLVGLEAMASGGVAFVGEEGGEYITAGHDAVAVQTSDAREIVHHAVRLYTSRETVRRLRRAARRVAALYTWPEVVRRLLLPMLEQLGVRFPLLPGLAGEAAPPGGPAGDPVPRRGRLVQRPAPCSFMSRV